MLYGDTDSIFVRLPEHMRGMSMAELFCTGSKWATEITQHIASTLPFQSYIELEFDKVLVPVVLWKKKRYSGLSYESPDKSCKFLARVIELARRDSLPQGKTLEKDILH